MNRDEEQLRLLSIFHYIVSGLAALFSFFPLFYAAMGGVFVWAAQHPGANNNNPPPPFLGWIFIGIGGFGLLIALAMAICILIAGRSIATHRRYTFVFVIGCVQCLFMPFGTILGVFTLIVLSRESVKTLFKP